MAFSVTPTAGIDFNATYLLADLVTIGPLGLAVNGSDGKIYVLAKAGAAIPANTAVCAIDPVTFVAAATGGTYLSPAVALATGTCAWFAKANV